MAGKVFLVYISELRYRGGTRVTGDYILRIDGARNEAEAAKFATDGDIVHQNVRRVRLAEPSDDDAARAFDTNWEEYV